jgi:thioesterase domain-containing protein
MAERYVREIHRVRPEGSYCLGGWSFGALVAFEMARRLREERVEVACWPSWIRRFYRRWRRARPVTAALLRWFRRDLAGLGQGDMEIADSDLLRAEGEVGIDGDETAAWRPLFQLFCTNVEAMQTYHPAPYTGRAVLFLAPGPDEGEPDRRAGAWRRPLAGETEFYTISGDRYTCLREPHVAALADRLGTVLREAWPCSLGLGGSHLPVSKESL